MNFEESFSIIDGLIISVVSILIVFFILIIISFSIEGFKLIFYKKEVERETMKDTFNIDETTSTNNEEDLIAVITATIQSYNEEQMNTEDKLAIMAAEIQSKTTKTINHLDVKRIKKLKD